MIKTIVLCLPSRYDFIQVRSVFIKVFHILLRSGHGYRYVLSFRFTFTIITCITLYLSLICLSVSGYLNNLSTCNIYISPLCCNVISLAILYLSTFSSLSHLWWTHFTLVVARLILVSFMFKDGFLYAKNQEFMFHWRWSLVVALKHLLSNLKN